MSSIFKGKQRTAGLLSFVAILAIGVVGLASGDVVIVNEVGVTGASQKSTNSSGTLSVKLEPNDSSDPVNGCNADGPATVRVTLQSSNTAAVQLANGGVVDFNSCTTHSLGYTTHSAGNATITIASVTGGRTHQGNSPTYVKTDNHVIQVSAPAPTDTTRPTSSATATKVAPAGAYVFGDWTNQDVSVALSGSDNVGGSGLKEIRYTTNGDTPTASHGSVYSAAILFDSAGVHTLKWVAVDNAGNVESPVNSGVVKIDKTAPSVQCGAADGEWHAENVSLGCTASDGASGIAEADQAFSLATTVAAGEEDGNASTGSRTVTDAAGNSATAGPVGGNKVDRKAPGVSCDAADGAWHATNVSLGCTASDGGSGIAEADESFSLSTTVGAGEEDADASTGSRVVTDAMGNSTTAGPIAGNKVDRKAPGVSCDSADGEWHNTNVSIACTASDGGSGIEEADESFSLSTTVAAGEEDGNASTGSRTITDGAGNSTDAGPVGGNKVDRKAPGVSCDAADGAWHADNVSLGCTASDGGSGIAEADESFSLSTTVAAGEEDGNASTGSRTITDDAGNSTTAGPIAGNKVDRKDPGVSCDAADGAWHADNVSLGCTASDGGSGIAEADESFSLSTTVGAGEEDANAATGSRVVTDAMGNSTTAGPIAGNKVDRKAPGVSCDAADGDWHNDNVSIACTASDSGSGIAEADESFSLSTTVAAGQEDANASTGSRLVTDATGNSATAGPVAGNKVDRKAPGVSCDAADGDWHADNVSIACTASDGGSGIPEADESFSLSTTVAAGAENANAATGSRTITDGAGNSANAGPVGGNKVDRKGPAITCGTTPSFGLGQSPADVTGTFTDGGVGPASGNVSAAADTATIGAAKSITLTKSDDLGNVGSAQCSYAVIYNWDGFFAPVDNPTTGKMNGVKAGSSVPLKFSLGANAGLDIFAFAPRSTAYPCSGTAPVDPLPADSSTAPLFSNSGLSYDALSGQYTYVWKTDKAWANQCRQLVIGLNDGTSRARALNFKIVK